MGDDGVGPAVVDALRSGGAGDRAELIDAGLAFSEVLCDLDPGQPLVIVDAVRGGGPPGSIYRLHPGDLLAEGGPTSRAVSLHEISVLPALRMEELSGRRFNDVTIFGVEPETVEWGEGLSQPVARAVRKLLNEIRRYLDERAAARGPAGPGETLAACGSENT